MSFQKILVALDDSDLGQATFDRAIDLAQLSQSAVMLFSGVSSDFIAPPATVPSTFGLITADTTGTAYEVQQINLEHYMAQMQSLLDRHQTIAQAKGLVVETALRVGEIGPLVCEVAQDWQADLIVVGRRGRTGLSEALLGSVSNYVLHHASCCVLVVQGEETVPAT